MISSMEYFEDQAQGPVLFYEINFYPLSNFSSFQVEWKGKLWPTSEHAYHSEKFEDEAIKEEIRNTRSAHDAFRLSRTYENKYRKDWNGVRVGVMEDILRAKLEQHTYVKKKLLETGTREIIESSPKDAFWGWGPNKDGENQLGKLWMKLREEIKAENK